MKKNFLQEFYQMTISKGDIVLLPNETVGIVNCCEIICGGNCKRVKVYPFTNLLHKLFLFSTNKTEFYDKNINKLKLLHRAHS